MLVIYAAAGGAIGAALRYLAVSRITHWVGATFPYGTMAVNILGSLLMGMLISWLTYSLPHSNELRTFLAVGVLGGFTTFSAFSLEAMQLLNKGDVMSASGYIVGSVMLSIVALIIGLSVTKMVLN